jgi:tuftelin-interacting protein 11
MPSIRRAALNWSPRDRSESMLAVVDTWFDVLPKWIIENLLEQIILPRIHDTVDK